MRSNRVKALCLACVWVLAACGGGGGGEAASDVPVGAQVQTLFPAYPDAASMRQAASFEADWGTLKTQLGMGTFVAQADDLARLFREDKGAVMCQGAAYYLHLRYLEAGYRTYQVGFETDDYSHAVTLVEVALPDGSTALTVQDPTFNHSYVDARGRPMSVFSILEALGQGRPQDIVIDGGAAPTVEFLFDPDDSLPRLDTGYVTGRVGPSTENPRYDVYSANLTVARFADQYAAAIQDYATEKGVPASPLYLLFGKPSYVLKTWPMDESEAAEATDLFNRLTEHYQRHAR